MSTTNERLRFQKKVWITTAIVAFFVIVIWIAKAIFNVLLLQLAGTLIAIYFIKMDCLHLPIFRWP
jgi:hypothetical protein